MSLSSQNAINYYNLLRQKQAQITEGQPGPEYKPTPDGVVTQPENQQA